MEIRFRTPFQTTNSDNRRAIERRAESNGAHIKLSTDLLVGSLCPILFAPGENPLLRKAYDIGLI